MEHPQAIALQRLYICPNTERNSKKASRICSQRIAVTKIGNNKMMKNENLSKTVYNL